MKQEKGEGGRNELNELVKIMKGWVGRGENL